jgi:hypothetical protein
MAVTPCPLAHTLPCYMHRVSYDTNVMTQTLPDCTEGDPGAAGAGGAALNRHDTWDTMPVQATAPYCSGQMHAGHQRCAMATPKKNTYKPYKTDGQHTPDTVKKQKLMHGMSWTAALPLSEAQLAATELLLAAAFPLAGCVRDCRPKATHGMQHCILAAGRNARGPKACACLLHSDSRSSTSPAPAPPTFAPFVHHLLLLLLRHLLVRAVHVTQEGCE